MDPNAAYRLMNACFSNGEWVGAHEAARGLLEWVRSGGFLPNLDGPTSSRIVGMKCVKVMVESSLHLTGKAV